MNDNEVITRAYVDQFHQENERSRRDLGLDFYDESKEVVKNNVDREIDNNNITNLDSNTVNRIPCSDKELANKKYVDESLGSGIIFRFNQILQNYLKVSFENDIHNLTKYNKIQIIDTTITKYPNTGGYCLQNWVIKCNDKNNIGKIQDFIKTNSATGYSGATNLPPIGDSFMYIETSSNNHGNIVFVSFE